MPVIAHTKTIKRRRRRRLVPSGRRPLRNKSLYPRRTIYLRRGRFVLFKHRSQRLRLFRRFNMYALPSAPKRKSYVRKYTPKPKPKVESFKQPSTIPRKPRKPRQPTIASLRKKKDADFFRQVKKIKKEFYKPRERRGGDTSKWRTYKNFGDMKPLGPTLIFELIPTKDFFFHYGVWSRKDMGRTQRVMRQTREAMEDMLKGLVKYAKFVIGKYVPEETGDLRNAMVQSIEKTKIHRYSMKVELDTGDVDYANVVNHMPQSMIRHNMGMGRIGPRSHQLLHDPKAVKGWYQFIEMQLNTEAKILIKQMITRIQEIWVTTVTTRNGPSQILRRPEETPVYRYIKKSPNQRRGYTIKVQSTEEDKVRADYTRNATRRYLHKDIINKTTYMEYPRNTIKGFFKIRGLNKK